MQRLEETSSEEHLQYIASQVFEPQEYWCYRTPQAN
uniref:Uncharacterized protein n=1 Tax=Arundo donax TaxID=35708 RepID=A0A0A9BGP1_ARUDO